MKNYIYLLVSLILLSCNKEDNFIENEEVITNTIERSSKSTDAVSLVKSWTSSTQFRWYESFTRKFTVKVANLAFDKKVSVYNEKVDGSWDEIPLTFTASIDNGAYEIWTGAHENSGSGIQRIYDDQFVVKYEVNGNTYWDNNDNANYIMSKSEGYYFADPNLMVSVDIDRVNIFYDRYTNETRFNVTADVRNIAPEKEVGVVYTTDGWQTEHYFPITFRRYWTNGPSSYILSPNNFNIERWNGNTKLDVSVDLVEYAIVYKVNDATYWDNNFGGNYTITK